MKESGLLGGEAGSGGGLGALTAPEGTFSAASDKTSRLRSPAFASLMILLAMISSLTAATQLTNLSKQPRNTAMSVKKPTIRFHRCSGSPHA
jgi:hypothetical protein